MILPNAPEPTLRKPGLALAICGAVLVVPLALSVPGGSPEAEVEVVLAAGSPDGKGEEDVAGSAYARSVVDDAGRPEGDTEADADDLSGGGRMTIHAKAVSRSGASSKGSTGGSSASSSRSRTADADSKAKPKGTKKASSSTATRATPSKVTGLTAMKVTATTNATASAQAASSSAPAKAASAPPPVKAASSPAPPPVKAASSPPPPPPPPLPPRPAPVASGGDGVWDLLALCESGNTNDPNAPYYGYFQFSAGTWLSMGETGLPDQFSRQHQLAVAKRLQAASGWGPWPACSRKLGLR